MKKFLGKDVFAAQKVADGSEENMLAALIAQCVKIDGKAVVMEDISLMDGFDVLTLMQEFSSFFTSAPKK